MAVTRWSASYVVRWTTIITYDRRRLGLLDWIEAHLDPVAFTRDDDSIGVAIKTPDHRVVVHPDRLVIQLRSPDADIAILDDAIRGFLDCMEPRNVQGGYYHGAVSTSLDGDYERARRALADRAVPGGLPELLGDAFDCSHLLDINFGRRHGTVEFGIVDQDELYDRITEPWIGRTGGERPVYLPSWSELASVSLYAAASAHLHYGAAVPDNAEAIRSDVTEIEAWASALAEAIKQNL